MENFTETNLNIPLADEDAEDDTEKDITSTSVNRDDGLSIESLSSSSLTENSILDPDNSTDEQEEKVRLISQVLELQNTLDDLSQRVNSVKEENLKLKSENQVLGEYIGNLMSASSVFQFASPKIKKFSFKH